MRIGSCVDGAPKQGTRQCVEIYPELAADRLGMVARFRRQSSISARNSSSTRIAKRSSRISNPAADTVADMADMEELANDLLRVIDILSVAVSYFAIEASTRRLTPREIDVIELSASAVGRIAERLAAPWRCGQVGSITLP